MVTVEGHSGTMGELKTPGTPVLSKGAHGGSQLLAGGSQVPATVKSKLVFVGDCECGKTVFIKRYMTGNFIEEYTPTGMDTHNTTYDVSDTQSIQVSLWDTSGQEEYNRVRPLSYSDADIILLCFSIGSQDSLSHVVSKWYPEIRENCPNQPIILVGCQKDLRDEHKSKKKDSTLVSYDQGSKTAKTIDAVMYTEVSAKTSRKSVKDAVEVAAMSSARHKMERKNSTFKRRTSIGRKRFSDMSDARRQLRKEAAKSCVVM